MSEVSTDDSFYSPFSNEVAAWRREYTPGPLTEDEFNQFFEAGFVIKKNLLQREQLDPVIKSIEGVVDEVAQKLYQAVRVVFY